MAVYSNTHTHNQDYQDYGSNTSAAGQWGVQCPQCGHHCSLAPDWNFCPECGTRLYNITVSAT